MNEELAHICLKEAHECAELHKKYSREDRWWRIALSSFAIFSAIYSTASAWFQNYVSQAAFAVFSGAMILILRVAVESESITRSFLTYRQKFLEMAAKNRGY